MALAALALVVIILWLLPAVGMPLAAAALLWWSPIGTTLADRLAVLQTLTLGVLTAGFVFLRMPVAAVTLQALCTVALVALGVWRWRRPTTAGSTSFDPASAVVLVAMVGLALLILGPVLGATPAQALSSLMSGWDHSSHFAMFVGSVNQGVTSFLTDNGTVAFGASYPAVHVWSWAAVTSAYVGPPVEPAELILPYTIMSGLATALALGVLVAVAADIGRAAARSPRIGAAAGALVCGLLFWVGTATAFHDHGHVNYLMTISVAASATWYALRFQRANRPWLSWLVLAAGALFLAIAYPPTAAAIIPAGAWMLWRSTSGHRWWRIAGLAAFAVAGSAAALRLGVTPDTLDSVLSELVAQTGGLQSFDVMIIIAAPLLLLLLGRHLYVRSGADAVMGLTGAIGGLAALSLLLTWYVLRTTSLTIAGSYYTTKLWLGVWLMAEVVLAATIAVWFSDYLTSNRQSGAVLTTWFQPIAWLALVAVVGSSAGYFGPRAEALPTGSPLAPSLAAASARKQLADGAGEGTIILNADSALATPGAQPLLWDGGDVKNNHYLMAMNGGVDSVERSLISTFPAPFGQGAADLLGAYLGDNPNARVEIVYWRPESQAILQKLRQQHPDQVVLRNIG